MSLLSLPNELLFRIAQYLEYADEVNAYSQTCRLLHSLANRLLFHHVQERQVEAIMHTMRSGDHVLLKRLMEAGICTEIFGDTTQHSPLRAATGWGHIGNVQVLLDLGQYDLNHAALYNESPLVCALINGHLDIARLLISRGADPNFAEPDNSFDACAVGRTPLGYAAKEGPLEAVRLLVEEAAVDLDPRDANGWTPLFFAASNGFLDAVKLLLSAGADPRAKDNEGKTILFYAAQGNHKQTVSCLLEIPGHSDYLLNELDGTALAYIASKGKGQTADLLLNCIDLNARITSLPGLDELSRLLCAYAACGQRHFVQLLLEQGCDPLAQILLQNRIDANDENFGQPASDKFDSPLKKAAANGHTDVVSMLLHSIRTQNHSQLGPSIMEVISIASERNEPQLLQFMLNSEIPRDMDIALNTCLSEALLLAASHEEPARMLLDHGANPDREGDGGSHVLAKAVEYGTPATVRMLLNMTRLYPLRCDLDWGRKPQSLLGIAQKIRNFDKTKLLLEEPHFRPSDEDCQHALSNAVSYKHVEIVRYFLDHGFDANGKGVHRDGTRPLLALATDWIEYREQGPDPVVMLLLDRGAAVDITDDSQRTALWYAARNSNTATNQTLLNHGADPLHEDCDGRTPLHVSTRSHDSTHMRTILRSIEAKKIERDFIDFLPEKRYVPEQQEDKRLKYLTQHRYRMMYPCS